MLYVHARLYHPAAVRLQNAGRHALGHFGGRIADIDLSAGDIVLTAIERETPGDSGDAMLGGGIRHMIWARRVSGNRTVVDDAAAARFLVLHELERRLGAEEDAGEVHVHDGGPLLETQFLDGDAGRVQARVVEENIQAAELL